MFASVFPGLVTWLYFIAFPGATMTAAMYGTNKVVQVLLPVLWVRFALGRTVRVGRPTPRALATGAVSGLILLAAMLAVYLFAFRGTPLLDKVPATVLSKLGDFSAATPLRFMVFGLFIIIGNSAIEEYYWRWFLFHRFREHMRFPYAVLFSSLSFMVHHVIIIGTFVEPRYFWTLTMFCSVCVAAGGAVWALLYRKTGSIFTVWISHLLADVAVIVVGLDLLRTLWPQ